MREHGAGRKKTVAGVDDPGGLMTGFSEAGYSSNSKRSRVPLQTGITASSYNQAWLTHTSRPIMNLIALVTGSEGFLGRNLCAQLRRRPGWEVLGFDLHSGPDALRDGLAKADVVFHLAGINRPTNVAEFATGNTEFTAGICRMLASLGRRPAILFSSSIQAELDNPYGKSKLEAENALRSYCTEAGGVAVVHRFKNLFGKWSRPNYNTVTATFCHNIARGLPVTIRDPKAEIELSYVDDVVAALIADAEAAVKLPAGIFQIAAPVQSRRIALGDLAALIQSFKDHRQSLMLADYSDPFVQALYATYLSFLPTEDIAYSLLKREDNRGSLAEFVKTKGAGQIFISRTKPGITRGNHFHHTKTEKFLVLEGKAIIRFRPISDAPGSPLPTPSSGLSAPSSSLLEFPVCGEDYRVVDIPPGYTHSIENVGDTTLVTLFWASEVFDPQKPDTYMENVL